MTNKFDYQIEILQAAKGGKNLEWKVRHDPNARWQEVRLQGEPEGRLFDFGTYEYRVKKEPDVIYSLSYKRGNDWSPWSNYFSKKEAEFVALKAQASGYTVIIRKFIEVLEDED